MLFFSAFAGVGFVNECGADFEIRYMGWDGVRVGGDRSLCTV